MFFLKKKIKYIFRKEAYTNTSIDQQLTDNFNNYLLNTKKGMFINQKENFIQLSSIFNW